jgi:hypothetical protein
LLYLNVPEHRFIKAPASDFNEAPVHPGTGGAETAELAECGGRCSGSPRSAFSQ